MSESEGAGTGAAEDKAETESGGAAQQDQPIVIHTQYVKDFSFENPNAPMILASLKELPQVDVRLDVGSRRLQERIYEIVVKVHVTAKNEQRVAFVCELEYGGLASVGAAVPEAEIEPTLFIEGARSIFPFARRVVADATRDGGFPPVLINPIDFAELYRRRKTQRESEASPAAGNSTGTA